MAVLGQPSIPRLIDDQDGVVRLAQRLRGGPLAVDTEADSYHHFREKVCLVQISFGDDTAVVDVLAGLDLEPLRAVLESPGITKILHGADYDLRLLDRDLGLRVGGLFDTMVAARLPRRGLAVLRELFAWRWETAQRRDVPPYRIAADSTLVAIAEHPETVHDFSRAGDAFRALSRDKSAEEIVLRVRRALETDPAEWPERRGRSRRRAPGPPAARVRLLRERRDGLAVRLDLEPSILANRATLEAITMLLDDGRDWHTVPGLRRWQIDLLEEVVS